MIIKFKRLTKEAIIPKYAHAGDAGLDLFAVEDYALKPGERHTFFFGFALEIPEGYVGLVWDKGSLPHKAGLHTLAGVCDSSYRGEVITIVINLGSKSYKIEKGDKIAQLLIQKMENIRIKEVKELSQTTRGAGRLGSSGRK